MKHSTSSGANTAGELKREIHHRLGFLPNFLTVAGDQETLQTLWRDLEHHYLDSPFPSRFKDQVFAYLSTHCSSPYCLCRHIGFLAGIGGPNGGEPLLDSKQILALLLREPPTIREMVTIMETLNSRPPLTVGTWEENHEEDLLACCVYLFRQGREHRAVSRTLSRFLGAKRFNRLAGFLGFIKSAHFWSDAHPELELEDDVSEYFSHNELGEWVSRHFRSTRSELTRVEVVDLIQHTTDIIQSVSPNGDFLFVNQAWHDILGYDADEVCSLNVFDVIHPEQHKHCQEKMRGLLNGRQLFLETVFQTKDGRAVYVEGNASCRIEDGKPIATRGFFRDVTKRKEIELERDQLIENLQRAMKQVQVLSRMLPVCSWCERIQNLGGDWEKILDSFHAEPAISISHGICPDCMTTLENDLD